MLGESYSFCKICIKDFLCSHGGASDLVRRCNSVTPKKSLKKRRTQCIIVSFAWLDKEFFYKTLLHEKLESSLQFSWQLTTTIR